MRAWIVGAMAAVLLAACGGDGGNGEGDGPDGADARARVAASSDGGGNGGGKEDGAAQSGPQVCTPAGGLRPLPADVHEASGAAPSRRHAGVFWTHNDSGDPVLFAVDSAGRLAGRVRVTGALVEDWEDVAAGPCPGGGDCLYVADIGDNQAKRPYVTVYRVPEPAPGDAETRRAEAIRLRYPDGAQDAEAMFVLPGGAIHIVTKGETGPVAVYRLAAPGGGMRAAQLERVRALAGRGIRRRERITGASASPDGRWVALRTLESVHLWPAAALTSASGGGAPREVNVKRLNETQGEGVGFASGNALLLTSEGGKKESPATFARLTCTL